VNAFRCMSQQSVDDVYTLSLMAYAYVLYNGDANGQHRVVNLLNAKAIQTGQGMNFAL
jgi:hypothetical protein